MDLQGNHIPKEITRALGGWRGRCQLTRRGSRIDNRPSTKKPHSQNIYRLSWVDTDFLLLLFINVFLKMTQCYERCIEKVIRKHTRQAPRKFIGTLRLCSSWGLSTRDAQFFVLKLFFVLKKTKIYLFFILFIANCCISIVSQKV